jgi:dolichol-phosphate mannosyltransferase
MSKYSKVLSLVIPAHNEEGSLENTVNVFHKKLKGEKIPHEIVVVNDNSTDDTEKILKKLKKSIKELNYVNNAPPNGFGYAVKKGLDNFSGDYVVLVMADASDSPDDLVNMYKTAVEKNVDCVFGSRFTDQANLVDYPKNKLFFNRLGNNIARIAFGLKYNDLTNAFKMYSKETMEKIKPLKSDHFNLTLELSLKSILSGASYEIVPTDWYNRQAGEAKLKVSKMAPKYLYTILLCLKYKYSKK